MDLREFLEKVVGSASIRQDEEGRWKIEPYEVVIIERNNRAGSITGYLAFKGERFQNFNCYEADFKTVEGMKESLNYGYAQAIKDTLIDGKIDSALKPFKFV